ncbi:unnamed protein product [Phytophthora lilii]|uniref:Unnamed protein product n=1 Tax=Phytophthora lilii TaxID=2077276 RepID=A0A9W6TIU9_9STRA|nr:unnamed protein product [Phytophthora lilii]
MYKAFKLDLSPAQANKVLAGKTIRLRPDQLGSGHEHMFHPENYKKLMRAKKANKGLTLAMAHGEVAATYHSGMTGSGFWGDMWRGIKKGARFLKDSGILSRLLDAGVPAAATYLGQPGAAGPVRAGIKQLTGVGMNEEIDGGRLSMSDVKSGAKKAYAYAKKRGIITDVIDEGEKFLLSKSDRPEHQDMIRSVRKGIRRKYIKMDHEIMYIDYDPLDAVGVYDNSNIQAEAEEKARKDDERRQRKLTAKSDTIRLAKCPSDLKSITL